MMSPLTRLAIDAYTLALTAEEAAAAARAEAQRTAALVPAEDRGIYEAFVEKLRSRRVTPENVVELPRREAR